MAGYIRQALANIADGLTIFAADINAEFNQLVAAFNGTTGHTHDGGAGNGPKLALESSITGILPIANGGISGINNLSATTDPTINEDANDNYTVGSWWVNTATDTAFICLDDTVGAAKWKRYELYSADLEAIAALTSAADKIPYATGAGTWALSTLTPYARTLIDDADAATARTTLGLVIGTNVQAQDTELSAIAGLTSAVDKGIQFTGAGTAGTFDLTSAGRALLDDADASTQLSTLGFTTYTKTLIDDPDAATARATLGVSLGSNVQAWDAGLDALAAFNTNGIIVQTANNTYVGRTLTGTANEITVTNGDGVSGNPTLSIPTAVTLTGKTLTGGTHTGGTWSSGAITTSSATITGGTITGITDLAVADGGTGVSTLTGIVKGNGTSAFSAATEGTDYWKPGGTDVAVADGGTNISSYTAGDLLYATGATTLAKLPKGAAGQALVMDSGGALPSWQYLGIGLNQAWTDVTASRTFNTAYQNTTGKPIFVYINADCGAGGATFQVSSDNVTYVTVGVFIENGSLPNGISSIIPNGFYYKIVNSVGSLTWVELR